MKRMNAPAMWSRSAILLSCLLVFEHVAQGAPVDNRRQRTTGLRRRRRVLPEKQSQAGGAAQDKTGGTSPASQPSSEGDGIGGPQTRIVGGQDAVEPFPWLIYYGGCGATLIHSDVALYAAHCVRENGRGRALVGAYARDSDSNGAIYTMESQSVIHPEYDAFNDAFDVAVMKLKGWMPKDTISLNKNNTVPGVAQNLTIAGLGRTNETGALPRFVQVGQVQLVDTVECASIYPTYFDTSSMICAASRGVDSCYGDSGGPLWHKGPDGKPIQDGIVSWGVGCARPQYPGVYANISAAYSWIQEQICIMSDNPPLSCNRPMISDSTKRRIRIDILHDEYAEDTGWRIYDVSSNLVAQREPFSANWQEARTLQSEYVELSPGTYTFVFDDAWGDGLTVGLQGYYNVHEVHEDGTSVFLLGGQGYLDDIWSERRRLVLQ